MSVPVVAACAPFDSHPPLVRDADAKPPAGLVAVDVDDTLSAVAVFITVGGVIIVPFGIRLIINAPPVLRASSERVMRRR